MQLSGVAMGLPLADFAGGGLVEQIVRGNGVELDQTLGFENRKLTLDLPHAQRPIALAQD